ncbi:Trifunctional nucleotide phosphoesterase protein YfkN [Fasciolopsis buskii]|uniref:Trifunctional nucleotide phosphoesterase protein YfkN n=1 Tax=Fasciolopsis buskii TaxID=27845 RepID=A0A8E0S8W1_9TREM|nr:Trifunctional nucleotide phosphoesterase protein YfkN [Fasciolopsis buski]
MGNAESVAFGSTVNTIHAKILHFNDVYNVEESSGDLCGGAARFVTALKQFRAQAKENTLILFSGDLLSPSSLSMTTEGSHMIDVLNHLNLDCAVIGNHDFDFGIDNLLHCIKRSNFPWLNGNCYDSHTMQLLCDLPPWHVIERGGIRFGLIGLVEPDWVDTLAVVNHDDVLVKDFCVEGRRIAIQLRQDEECDVIIALTHMRWPNDIRLATEVPEIDLVLGGHDHNSGFETVRSKDGTPRWVIKSGTDFRNLGHVHMYLDSKTKRLRQVNFDLIAIDRSWTPDPEVAKMVQVASAQMNERLTRVIGKTHVELDGRFASIRSQETNLGNFLADVALTAAEADCAIINSGTMRIDAIIPEGDFSLKHLSLILPMLSPTLVLDVTGSDIIRALENGVSQVSFVS